MLQFNSSTTTTNTQRHYRTSLSSTPTHLADHVLM